LAAEVNGEKSTESQNLPQRVSRYGTAKERNLQMSEYCKTVGDVKMFHKLKGCGNYLVFHDYFTVGQVKLHSASFCKAHLVCNLCAIRRASKGMEAYLKKYTAVIEDRPLLLPYLVTLTILNGDDLKERYMHFRGSFKRFMQSRRDSLKGQKAVEFAKAEGGFSSIETTNKGKGWHVHVHMVWLCLSPPDAFKLSEEWHSITGDSYIVDVRQIQGDVVDGFCEVFKYALKFSELSPEQNYEAFQVLKGQRLFDSFGIMKGVEIPESLLDDPLEDLPYLERFYKYIQGQGYAEQSTVFFERAPVVPSDNPGMRSHAKIAIDKNGSGFQFPPGL